MARVDQFVKRTDAYESTSDVVARMDAAIDHRCACGCGLALAPDGPSGYFASPECQQLWASTTQATDPADVYERPDADYYPIPAVEAGRDWHAETVEERLRLLRGMVEERRRAAGEGPGEPPPGGGCGRQYMAVWSEAPTRIPSTPPGAGWRIVVEWDEDGPADITHFGSPARSYMSGTWYTVRMFDARGREVARERRRGDFPY